MLKIINMYSVKIMAFVVLSTQLALNDCYVIWYQPEEPEGLEAFADQVRNYANHARCNWGNEYF